MRKHAVLEVILGNMQYWRSYWETCSTGGHAELEVLMRKHSWRLYWETCSTGGLSEEHAVLEV